MNVQKLIDELDNRFGNEYAPKHYLCIQEAVEFLREQQERITALEQLIAIKELNDTTTR